VNAPQPAVKLRAALYLRVSTARQAEHDVSIPDQRRQGEAYCAARGYELVETYIEPGASATNDRRPEFQRMMEAGTAKPATFDIVVVHSFSRFFRDHFELEFYVRKLGKNGVRLVSMTQELGDDPMHVMMRQIMALFDEYQSKENAKHTLRALKENARQGFWNGSLPPVGYRVVDAEKRGAKIKKVLEIDPMHADTVRLMFRLALEGDGTRGRMGVKAIAAWLNDRKLYTRTGGRWGVGTVHRILTRRTYIGEHQWGRKYKDGTPKAQAETVTVPVPPLIDRETFDAVQELLKSRSPMVVPGRTVSGPTLLTGICFCADCGGAMTLRTSGKAKHYRYYTCSTAARQGKTGCKGRTVQMDRLDHLVAEHLEKRLLEPERLRDLLAIHLDRREERDERRRAHAAELVNRAVAAEARLKRLYDAIESGVADLDDPSLRTRIEELKATRDQARIDAERARAAIEGAGQAVTPDQIARFAAVARRRMRGKDGGFRRDHLRALAQRVEVAEREVRIMGSRNQLLRVLASANSVETAANGVRTYVPEWRRGRDSNPRYADAHTGFRDRPIQPL
jgi:site-specific DNA recombinase